MKRQWSKISKVDWKKNCQLRILFSVKITLEYKHEIKTFSDTKAERIHHQQRHNRRNVKGRPSDGMKIPDGNMDVYKGMKSTENNNDMHSIKGPFPAYLNLCKG